MWSIILILKISLVATALGFFINSLLKFFHREHNQTFFKIFFSTIIWFGIVFFSIFPDEASRISEKLGLGESLNTLIFIGFVIVFTILFKIINIIERTEKNISEIIRKEALSKIKEKY